MIYGSLGLFFKSLIDNEAEIDPDSLMVKVHAVKAKGDPWLAYQFDSAVALVGSAIENATQETVNVGSDDKPKWRPKYTMKQLLDPDFRLPTKASENNRPIEGDVKGVHGIMFDEVS